MRNDLREVLYGIDLPEATYCIAHAINEHRVRAVQATLTNPKAILGVLSVEREGDRAPTLALLHGADPLVVDVAVRDMAGAMLPSLMYGLTHPVTRCEAIAFGTDEAAMTKFVQAAKHTFCGERVSCSLEALAPFSPTNPRRLGINLETGLPVQYWKPVACWTDQHRPDFDTDARIQKVQNMPCGQLKLSTRLRLWLAQKIVGLDTDALSLTGEDYTRRPFMLFDLRKARLKGFEAT